VNFTSTSRAASLKPLLTLALLALAVFLWGLDYKISKYDDVCGAPGRHVASVKLISENEQAHSKSIHLINNYRIAERSLFLLVTRLHGLVQEQELQLRSSTAYTECSARCIRTQRPPTELCVSFSGLLQFSANFPH
jgi:hypothetical protein